jgi:putative flippase GtrA
MSEDMTSTLERPAVGPRPRAVQVNHTPAALHIRVRQGVSQPHNWFQLVRFGAVGATGYVVNLAVFAACIHLAGLDYHLSAVIAWVVSVTNNFWLNRHWTFAARQTHPLRQAVRFFAVSAVVFGVTYGILVALVNGGMTKDLAQAIAIACGTPLNFVAQKLWSFKT